MKTRIIFILSIALAVIFILSFFTNRDYDITNYPSSGTTIVAFGDSLVAGVGSKNEGGFVSILEERIGEEIINLGVAGDTTADGLARVGDAVSYDPKVVILLLGGNDAIRRMPVEETFSNVRQMIDAFHESGSVVVLIGVQSGLLGDQYKKRYEALAREKGTAYVPDILDGLIGRSEYMADAIHPNNAGYEIIANRIEVELLKIIH